MDDRPFDASVLHETTFDDGTVVSEEVRSLTSRPSLEGQRADGSSVFAALDALDEAGIARGDEDTDSSSISPWFPASQIGPSGLSPADLASVEITPSIPFGDEAACDPESLARRSGPGMGGPPPCGPDAAPRDDAARHSAFAGDLMSSDLGLAASGGGLTVAPIPVPAGPPPLAGGPDVPARLGRRRRAPGTAGQAGRREATFSQSTSSFKKFCR